MHVHRSSRACKGNQTGRGKRSLKKAVHTQSYTGRPGPAAKYQRRCPDLKKRRLFSWCFWATETDSGDQYEGKFTVMRNKIAQIARILNLTWIPFEELASPLSSEQSA
jgi:hypothetical protein